MANLIGFGPFGLDLQARELRKHGLKIGLPEQSIRILAMLLERPGQVVMREEIRKKLWPNDTIVEFDHSINAAIKRLRRALGDEAETPRYVETLPRRGYRFIYPLDAGLRRDAAQPRQKKPQSEGVPPPLVGLTLSHYRVEGVLGRGGMGVVYRAQDVRLRRPVALKFLPDELIDSPPARERFEREARAASSLNHPNICTIYEVEEHAGQPFIVMELLEGQTLRERIGAGADPVPAQGGPPGTPLPIDELLDFAGQIAAGLDAAHSQGIIHRDIKPANIFITARGHVKILDFGLAKLTEPGERGAYPSDEPLRLGREPAVLRDTPTASMTAKPLTLLGAAMGTAAYMSPEQIRGEKLDARTDLFSFGLVLYEMATGQPAFPGDTVEAVHDAILGAQPKPARELRPDLPPKLEEIIGKALEKDRTLRYRTAVDLLADLKSLKHDTKSVRNAGISPVPPPAPVRRRWVALASATLLAAASVALYFHFHPRLGHRLTDQDTVVLADFSNTTGDPIFDGTLRQGLETQLEQSPFLNLLSDSHIAQTLALMARRRDARLTRDLAREVCQRTGSTATIEGSIATLGSQYVLGLRAVNCHSGDLLATEQVTANGKEQVVNALAQAAAKVREKLGESLASVEKYDALPENVTTPSLEALQAFSLGYQADVVKEDFAAAVSFFQRAVQLDPNFATAYAWLATNYNNLGERGHGVENIRKAYELRDRVKSERERLFIEMRYTGNTTGDLEAVRKICELWIQTYPRDVIPYRNILGVYTNRSEYDKALSIAQEAYRLNPGSGLETNNLVAIYLRLNRLDEAKDTVQQARAHHLDTPQLHRALYLAAFVQHDAAGMSRELLAMGAMGKAGEDARLEEESDTAAYGGQLDKASALIRRVAQAAERAGEKEVSARYQAMAALREALVGNVGLAKQQARAALALSDGRAVQVISTLALGLADDSREATRLAHALAVRFPQDTAVQSVALPMIHAALLLGSGSNAQGADKAIEALVAAAPYDLASFYGPIYPTYLRGQAYLAMHQGAAAAAEYQKLLDHPGVVQNALVGALAHLGLARAYALEAGFTGNVQNPRAGDNPQKAGQMPASSDDAFARARAAYQDFFALWKDADPDIPILKAARTEYAKLP